MSEDSSDDDFYDVFGAAILPAFLVDWQQLSKERSGEIAAFVKTKQFELQCKTAANSDSRSTRDAAVRGAILFPCVGVIVSPEEDLAFAPALLVGSFQQTPAAIMECGMISSKLRALYGPERRANNPTEEKLKAIIDDHRYQPMKRTPIPLEATNGIEVFAFHALVYREEKESELLTILTRPGSEGAPMLHIPDAVLYGRPVPSGVETFFKRQRKIRRVGKLVGMVLKCGVIFGACFLLSRCGDSKPDSESAAPKPAKEKGFFQRTWEEAKRKEEERRKGQ